MRFLQQVLYRYQQFMYGRYGVLDGLTIFLLVLYFLINLFARLFRLPYLTLLNFVPLYFILFRFFSKNYVKRQQENQRFMRIFRGTVQKFKTWKMILTDPVYRYYRCPKCKSLLRLPKSVKHKKIELHCRNCDTYFIKKT